jgi:histidine ammonia-lyase
MAVRLNGIARGGSGTSVAAAEALVALLNHGVHPRVPSTGSVGAGDLGQLASIALVAVGQGQARYQGELLPGAEALARAGIEPLVPSGKDGLALISPNAVSIGEAALLVARGHHLAKTSDLAAALPMAAVRANPSILHPAVGAATGFVGQRQAADHLRELLAGSPLFESDRVRSVQDALSFRVVPQVHGAFRHYLAGLEHAVTEELNAAADNPLASVAEQTMISHGTFHPMVLASP